MTNDDGSIKQIIIVILTAIVVSAISFIAQAALSPPPFNPYLEDRKLIQATIVDLKDQISDLKSEIKRLREDLRRNSNLNDSR
jgi:hypothetical protein